MNPVVIVAVVAVAAVGIGALVIKKIKNRKYIKQQSEQMKKAQTVILWDKHKFDLIIKNIIHILIFLKQNTSNS